MALPVNYTQLNSAGRRRVRMAYIELQEGKCWHCKTPLDGPAAKSVTNHFIRRSLFPPRFFEYPVHLHHDHKTHMTIGAVHCHCNAVLWQYHGQ